MEGFPSVDEVTAKMESDISAPATSEQPKETQTEKSVDAKTTEEQAQAIIDLGKASKVKWFDGKEYSPEDLRKMSMLQSDYTKKTQALAEERKNYEAAKEEKKFYDNLRIDLNKVKANPELAEEFKKVYPEKYHQYLDFVYSGQSQPKPEQPNLPPELKQFVKPLEDRVNELYESERTRKEAEFNANVEKNQAFLEKEFAKNSKQYDLADNELVLSRLQALQAQGVEINEDVIKKSFESVHNKYNSLYEKRYSEQVKKQKTANANGKDMGPGGASPGQAPLLSKTFNEAREAMIKGISGG